MKLWVLEEVDAFQMAIELRRVIGVFNDEDIAKRTQTNRQGNNPHMSFEITPMTLNETVA